jgi:hypothetical protein
MIVVDCALVVSACRQDCSQLALEWGCNLVRLRSAACCHFAKVHAWCVPCSCLRWAFGSQTLKGVARAAPADLKRIAVRRRITCQLRESSFNIPDNAVGKALMDKAQPLRPVVCARCAVFPRPDGSRCGVRFGSGSTLELEESSRHSRCDGSSRRSLWQAKGYEDARIRHRIPASARSY